MVSSESKTDAMRTTHGLPRPLSHARKLVSKPVRLCEAPSVERHPHDELVGSDSLPTIELHGAVDGRLGGMSIKLGLVGGDVGPAAGKVVGHQVPEVEVAEEMEGRERGSKSERERRGEDNKEAN